MKCYIQICVIMRRVIIKEWHCFYFSYSEYQIIADQAALHRCLRFNQLYCCLSALPYWGSRYKKNLNVNCDYFLIHQFKHKFVLDAQKNCLIKRNATVISILLSCEFASGSDKMPCIKIEKPLVAYRYW